MNEDELIAQNVAQMRAKGATDDQVRHYLVNVEGLIPKTPVGPPAATGSIDLHQGAQPTPTQLPASGGWEGVLDHGLDMATLGGHKNLLGVGQAIGDIGQHGFNAHPVDTFNQSVAATKQREQAAESQHPIANSAAGATGFFGALAADAPLQAMLATRAALAKGLPMLPQAVDYAEGAPGVGAAIKRIAQSGKTGAATGAVVGGLSSDGTPGQRLTAMAGGAVGGGVLGGGAQALGEAGGGLKSLWQYLATPTAQQGALNADRRIVGKLAQDRLDPTDILPAAQKAQNTGSPALLAHLGGPSLDNTTWLASTGPSPEAASLKQSILGSKTQEGDLLNRGLRTSANLGDQPFQQAAQEIASRKVISANRLYGNAEAQPPINDPEIARRIIQEPELVNAMARTVKSFGESATPEDLKAVQSMMYARSLLDANPNANIDALVQPIPVRLLNEMKKEADATIQSLALKSPNFTQLDKRRIQGAMGDILARADAQSPGYATARTVFKNDADREAAQQAGLDLFKSQPEEIAGHLAGAIPLDPEAPYATNLLPQNQPDYRQGGVEAISRAMAEKNPESNLTKNFLTSPADQGRVAALLGDEGAAQFAPYREQAQTLNRVYDAATGNSKTAERQGTQGEVVDRTAVDAAHFLTSPHRAFYNLPGKFADARDREVKQAMLQSLARKLQLPATSPELPTFVEQLYKSMQGSEQPDVFLNILSRPSGIGTRQTTARGAGLLSGLLSGGGAP